MFGHNQRDRRLSVQTRFGALLFGAVFDVTDITQLDRVRSAIRDHQIIKLRRVRNASHRAHGQFALAFFDSAARNFQVLQLHRVGHVARRDIERAHLVWINPDFNFAQASADDFHVAYAIDRLDHPLDLFVGDVGDFAQRSGSRNRDSQNRRRVGVELLDNRDFRRFGKIVDNQVDFVAHFLRGHVGVFLQNEIDEDLRYAFERCRTQLVDAADRVDRAFDLVGDLSLDLLRRCAGISYCDGDRWQVDFRKQIHAERSE